MKHFKILLLLLLFISNTLLLTFNVSMVYSDNSNIFYNPVVEVADLDQNGSLTNPYIYNLTHEFSYVEKINWVLVFADAQIDFTLFDGTAPLTNGINVLYNSISLVDNKNITNNHELAHFAFNMEVLSDEQSPKDRVIIIQWLLTSFIPNGIQITPTKTIHIYIQDDLTALGSLISFTATFKGYKTFNNMAEQTQQVNQQNNLYIPIISEIVTVFSQNILISVIVVVVSAAVIWKRVFR